MSYPTLLEKLETELRQLEEWHVREAGAAHHTPKFIFAASLAEYNRLKSAIAELRSKETPK